MNTILLTILIDLIFQYECNEISSSTIRKSIIQFFYIFKPLIIYYFKKKD
jgi:hypothetical protein